ncbi:MAG TPA: hypothetical protein VJB94_05280 [Candidatus Nanoarchaeia archaeon]|nr:hypothetical protein [Candidatus Nanoarchaeia archaeon]
MNRKVVYEVKGVSVANFEPKNSSIVFKIKYTKNNTNGELIKTFNFSDAASLVSEVMREIKRKDNVVDLDEEDFLADYQVVDFVDQEEVEEKLLNFFNRIKEKVRILKKSTNASNYMKLFDEIKIARMEL